MRRGRDSDRNRISQLLADFRNEKFKRLIGPSGAGIVVFCQTDNKNRLLGELRTVLSKHTGSIAGEHSVLWQFSKNGVVTVKTDDYEKVFFDGSDAGAEDVIDNNDGTMDVITPLEKLDIVSSHLASHGWTVQSSVPTLFPNTIIGLEENEYEQLQNLIDALEDLDDVNEVCTNGVLRTP